MLAKISASDRPAKERLRLLASSNAAPKSERQVGEEEKLRALLKNLNERRPAPRSDDHNDYPPAAA